ncbi:MAG: transglutaminase family protein [Lachnospiraceae bacterium]|nr:transglutaminase family protein [Lachnospiraceae bacterium]
MKNLFFDYYMQIDYSIVVSKCNYTIKCIPESNERQTIDSLQMELFPETKYSYGRDGLGNRQIYGSNDLDHTTFHYHITGHAITGLHVFEEAEDDSKTMIFRHPHGLNTPGEKIKAYFHLIRQEIRPEEDAYMNSLILMNRLFCDFSYKQFVTNTETSAEEAFALGKGVCQDYAHIFISLLHLAGIPARYVVGLIMGEGASHAWVEILHNGYWYGLDPTNNVPVTSDHIKIGVGRDAKDCMINRGIMHGGGLHTQKIVVNVKEMEQ